jgi:hypothetical protein
VASETSFNTHSLLGFEQISSFLISVSATKNLTGDPADLTLGYVPQLIND